MTPALRWGEEEDYTDLYTVSTGMTPALRWAARGVSHFNVSLIVGARVDSVHKPHSL